MHQVKFATQHQVFYNANILSFHQGFLPGRADAISVRGNRIEAVGTQEEILTLKDNDTRLVDLGGRTLMPGLHDSHIHIWKVGNLATFMLDLRAASSIDDMLTMLSEFHRQYPESEWITARGFNEVGWKDGQMPTSKDLDKVIGDKPVYVIRTCAHIAVCNSKALEVCGITANTIAPDGGVIYKDSSGRPNGVFSETALGLIASHIPPYSKTQLKTMVRAARAELYRYGITAATDPAADPMLLETYHEMNQAGELGFRLQAIPILLPDGGMDPYPVPEYYSSQYLTVNTVKFFSDGGLSGRTAALKRPYKPLPRVPASPDQGHPPNQGHPPDHSHISGPSHPPEYGILRLRPDQYLALARSAQEKGLGIATHAIGDAAIEFVIDIYRQLHRSFPGGLRRIEHLGLPEERHLQDMAAHNIGTSMQTIFINELGKNYIANLDEDYLQSCFPVKSVLNHGILTALSSDAPVVRDLNPFKGMEAAITRRDKEGRLIAPDEGIRIEEALNAYTHGAAKISALPQLGALEPGKLADLIILDRNPLTTLPERLAEIRVEATYVDGVCMWQQ